MEYNSLNNLNDSDRSSLTSTFQGILTSLKHISVNKTISYLRYIPEQCRMHHNSIENRKLRSSHEKKFHPVKPYRGEIYNAFITEGVVDFAAKSLTEDHRMVKKIQSKK